MISDVKNKLKPLNIKETRDLKVLAGQLTWIGSQTRSDLAFDACEVNTFTKDATYEDLKKVNKSIRKTSKMMFVFTFLI